MVSSFPFGWVKDINSDNWQLLWNSINKEFFAKSAKSKKVVILTQADNWVDAKIFADRVKDSPSEYLSEV